MIDDLTLESDRHAAPAAEAPDVAFERLLRRFRSTYPEFLIADDVIRRYHLAGQARGFVILSGPSGTGKTWLAQAYAASVGARVKLVAVDPSWSSNEDLLGYLSPLDGFYHHTPFSEFIQESAREWELAGSRGRIAHEFHVILDEMNLARVEHYFSRFLSAMEVRSREGVARMDLAPGHSVELTPNLRFTGTVNVDETTHGFADKVFDRAQLIELPLRREDVVAFLGDAPYAGTVLAVWDALRPLAPFGFRVLHETRAYLRAARDVGTTWEIALDEQLVQKVLPRVRGADARFEETITGLLTVLGEGFPLARAKSEQMLEDYRTHGFASFV
jgi:hypothetical protein